MTNVVTLKKGKSRSRLRGRTKNARTTRILDLKRKRPYQKRYDSRAFDGHDNEEYNG